MQKSEKSLEQLLKLKIEAKPDDFNDFWQARFNRILDLSPRPKIFDAGLRGNIRVFELEYRSTGNMKIYGWLTLPAMGLPKRGFVVLHGYGGRMGPDFELPFQDAAIFYPCCRGLGASKHPSIPADPQKHVLHKIESKDEYVIGGCVEDTWLALSAMIEFFPELKGRIGLLGLSFGGGIAVLAAGFDHRIARLHVNVPSFAAYPERMKVKTIGSAAALQNYHAIHGNRIFAVLDYYDAAHAAKNIKIPTLCACATRDEVVSPESQFAIYNNLSGRKELFLLDAGHCNYPGKNEQDNKLLTRLNLFFKF